MAVCSFQIAGLVNGDTYKNEPEMSRNRHRAIWDHLMLVIL